MKVRDPRGHTWRVTRRWVPWRMARRHPEPSLQVADTDGVPGGLLWLLVGLIIWPVLGFVVIFVLEAAVMLLVVPFVAAARIIFGRKWVVEARLGFRPYWEAEAGTWSQSGRHIRRIAEGIERGDLPVRTLGEDDVPVLASEGEGSPGHTEG